MTDIKDVDVFNKIVIDLKGVTDKAKAKIIVNGMTTKYPAIPSPTPDAEKLAAEEAKKVADADELAAEEAYAEDDIGDAFGEMTVEEITFLHADA
jgi:hypothetical protein